ncbi:hypothetical protein FA95DRAFT_1575868 [Auriscalpium vulgare]|uniref:Uncharacterized protein n=1 Tax=Auriscalpium vulgare TaxID=40419 RepID=A0ACB8RF32_9AGAM|nr:hypothetical protein FA95DRAFT_1575868 [Auriscalpium vulgare]
MPAHSNIDHASLSKNKDAVREHRLPAISSAYGIALNNRKRIFVVDGMYCLAESVSRPIAPHFDATREQGAGPHACHRLRSPPGRENVGGPLVSAGVTASAQAFFPKQCAQFALSERRTRIAEAAAVIGDLPSGTRASMQKVLGAGAGYDTGVYHEHITRAPSIAWMWSRHLHRKRCCTNAGIGWVPADAYSLPSSERSKAAFGAGPSDRVLGHWARAEQPTNSEHSPGSASQVAHPPGPVRKALHTLQPRHPWDSYSIEHHPPQAILHEFAQVVHQMHASFPPSSSGLSSSWRSAQAEPFSVFPPNCTC